MDYDIDYDKDEVDRMAHLDHLENELAAFRVDQANWKQISIELNDNAKDLRIERDEARRMYCLAYCGNNRDDAEARADELGWDCFQN